MLWNDTVDTLIERLERGRKRFVQRYETAPDLCYVSAVWYGNLNEEDKELLAANGLEVEYDTDLQKCNFHFTKRKSAEI